jgi:hypothetical protein
MSPLFIGGIISIVGFLLVLVFNIFRGTFSIGKFFNGFNIFSTGTQGKLLYYFIIGSIVAAVALGIYHKFTETTYSSVYKNQVTADNVTIDQKQIYPSQEDVLLIGIKIFGFKFGVTYQGTPSNKTTINNPNSIKTEAPKVIEKVKEIKEEIKPILKTKRVWFFFKKKIQ